MPCGFDSGYVELATSLQAICPHFCCRSIIRTSFVAYQLLNVFQTFMQREQLLEEISKHKVLFRSCFLSFTDRIHDF